MYFVQCFVYSERVNLVLVSPLWPEAEVWICVYLQMFPPYVLMEVEWLCSKCGAIRGSWLVSPVHLPIDTALRVSSWSDGTNAGLNVERPCFGFQLCYMPCASLGKSLPHLNFFLNWVIRMGKEDSWVHDLAVPYFLESVLSTMGVMVSNWENISMCYRFQSTVQKMLTGSRGEKGEVTGCSVD